MFHRHGYGFESQRQTKPQVPSGLESPPENIRQTAGMGLGKDLLIEDQPDTFVTPRQYIDDCSCGSCRRVRFRRRRTDPTAAVLAKRIAIICIAAAVVAAVLYATGTAAGP